VIARHDAAGHRGLVRIRARDAAERECEREEDGDSSRGDAPTNDHHWQVYAAQIPLAQSELRSHAAPDGSFFGGGGAELAIGAIGVVAGVAGGFGGALVFIGVVAVIGALTVTDADADADAEIVALGCVLVAVGVDADIVADVVALGATEAGATEAGASFVDGFGS
jgi:hypothetical protein